MFLNFHFVTIVYMLTLFLRIPNLYVMTFEGPETLRGPRTLGGPGTLGAQEPLEAQDPWGP
jgi:hypothetical protein